MQADTIRTHQMLKGLAFMHSNNRLHQSLGPNSLILSTIEERDAYVRTRLKFLLCVLCSRLRRLLSGMCSLAFAEDLCSRIHIPFLGSSSLL